MKYEHLIFNKAPMTVVKVNPKTQKAQQIKRAYEVSTKDTLKKAYTKPSSKKQEAFDAIVEEMKAVDGYGMRITGAGSDYFSCAYKATDDDGNKYIIYHTHVYRWAVPLN